MGYTAKKLLRELLKERFDRKNLVVKVENVASGESYEVDRVYLDEATNEVRLFVNADRFETEGG